MQLVCAVCDRAFDSLIIDRVMAWNDCYGKLTAHVGKKHPEVIADLQMDLQKILMVMSSYVTLNYIAELPDNDPYLNPLMDKMQGELADAIGLTINAQDEDDEGDEDLELFVGEEEEKEEKKPEDKEGEETTIELDKKVAQETN